MTRMNIIGDFARETVAPGIRGIVYALLLPVVVISVDSTASARPRHAPEPISSALFTSEVAKSSTLDRSGGGKRAL